MADSFNELFGLGSHAEDAALVGWWKCQETSGVDVFDASSNGEDAFIEEVDLTTGTGPGKGFPSAIRLAGDAAIVLPTISLGSNDATLLTRLKIDADAPASSAFSGFHHLGESTQNTSHYPYIDGTIYCATWRGTSPTTNSRVTVGDPTPALTSWRDVMVRTVSGGNWTFHLDGSQLSSVSAISTPYTGGSRWRLGYHLSNDDYYVKGYIADTSIWSRDLTSTEHSQWRSGPEPLNTAAPVASGTPVMGETLSCTSGTWNSQGNGTVTYSYQWTRSDDDSGTNEADISGATSSTYTPTVADEGKYLRCRVRGANDGGYDAAEDTGSNFLGDIAASVPAPTSLVATTVSHTQINLTWTDNSSDETGFELQRDTDDAFPTPTQINLDDNEESYNDTNLTASTTYYYRVRAVKDDIESDWSATASAATHAAPIDIVIKSAIHGHSAASPVNTQTHVVDVSSASHTHFAANPVAAQTHAITISDAQHGHLAELLTTGQIHVISPASVSHSHTAETPAIGHTHHIDIASVKHGHLADTVSLSAVHAIEVVSAVHGHRSANPTVTQTQQINVAGSSHGQVADVPSVGHTHHIDIASVKHGHLAELLDIAQTHVLAVRGTSHAHRSASLPLAQTHQINVAGASHGQVADVPSVVHIHYIEITSVKHGHLAELLDIAQTHVLAVRDAVHGHNADVVSVRSGTETMDLQLTIESLYVGSRLHGEFAILPSLSASVQVMPQLTGEIRIG